MMSLRLFVVMYREKLGFVGVIVITRLFFMIIRRALKVAIEAKNEVLGQNEALDQVSKMLSLKNGS